MSEGADDVQGEWGTEGKAPGATDRAFSKVLQTDPAGGYVQRNEIYCAFHLSFLYLHLLFLADLAGSQHEHSTTKSDLSLSKQQCNLLSAQVDTLKMQLSARREELSSLLQSHNQAQERLGSAGASVQQTRQQMLTLKAKVRNCVCSSKVSCLLSRENNFGHTSLHCSFYYCKHSN